MNEIEIKFTDLSGEEKVFLCTNIHAVSATKNPDDETYEQIEEIQRKFLLLPRETKNKLVSFETSKIIKEIGDGFNLQLLQMANISRTVRGYYFGEIRIEDFPNVLSREIPTDINIAQEISKQIIEKIIEDKSLGVDKNVIDISLSEAIQKFPNLGEQLITSSPIKLKIFPQQFRPSIKNWIEDYRQTMGIQKHGMMERGNYLFHSDNGKFLTSGERKKLAEILRSLDEDVTLKIDPERQEVVFDMDESKIINQESSSLITNNQDTRYKKISNFNSEYSGQVPNKNNIIQNQSSNSQTQRPQAVNPNFQPNFRPTFVEKKPDEKVMPSQNYQFSQKNQPSFQQNQKFANYQPYAGKSWEEVDKISDPKVKGNTVDLRN